VFDMFVLNIFGLQ